MGKDDPGLGRLFGAVFGAFVIYWILSILLSVGALAVVAYVVLHFVLKAW